MSELEDLLLWQIEAVELPIPEREVQWHPTRKWRSDFIWKDKMVIAECEGATYTYGRHTRGGGFEKDCEKYNTATLMGYSVYRFTRKMVESGDAISTLEKALEG